VKFAFILVYQLKYCCGNQSAWSACKSGTYYAPSWSITSNLQII